MYKVRRLFNLLRREVITGQYLDLRLAGPCATDQQALSVALLKSARYTVTRPLQLGATLASADEATLRALCTYGDAMGAAFQLRDDVLGVFGDPAVVVIGAGLAGLSAACHLRGMGRSVLLLEAGALPSGRAGIHTQGGCTFDTGPTALTMPDLIEDCFRPWHQDGRPPRHLTSRPHVPDVLRRWFHAAHSPGARLDDRGDPDGLWPA